MYKIKNKALKYVSFVFYTMNVFLHAYISEFSNTITAPKIVK